MVRAASGQGGSVPSGAGVLTEVDARGGDAEHVGTVLIARHTTVVASVRGGGHGRESGTEVLGNKETADRLADIDAITSLTHDSRVQVNTVSSRDGMESASEVIGREDLVISVASGEVDSDHVLAISADVTISDSVRAEREVGLGPGLSKVGSHLHRSAKSSGFVHSHGMLTIITDIKRLGGAASGGLGPRCSSISGDVDAIGVGSIDYLAGAVHGNTVVVDCGLDEGHGRHHNGDEERDEREGHSSSKIKLISANKIVLFFAF